MRFQDFRGPLGQLAAFTRDGEFVQAIPDGDDDDWRKRGFEVLAVCPEHPRTSAVDCLTCWPEGKS